MLISWVVTPSAPQVAPLGLLVRPSCAPGASEPSSPHGGSRLPLRLRWKAERRNSGRSGAASVLGGGAFQESPRSLRANPRILRVGSGAEILAGRGSSSQPPFNRALMTFNGPSSSRGSLLLRTRPLALHADFKPLFRALQHRLGAPFYN